MKRHAESTPKTAGRGEVLVAMMNDPTDFAIACEEGWYRIPVISVEQLLQDRWPPAWLAFYQTRVFGSERYSVRYYAKVIDVRQVSRRQLFPDEPKHDKTDRQYYQLMLSALQRLPDPIFARSWRRIVVIPTTWQKLMGAAEINDLYDESLLEDRLWAELTRLSIDAERQVLVPTRRRGYYLDFAIFCKDGKLDVETDGDAWHADAEQVRLDNEREEDLAALGWTVLRFNGTQIWEGMAAHCIPKIMASVKRLGGLTGNGLIPRRFEPEVRLALPEVGPAYDLD